MGARGLRRPLGLSSRDGGPRRSGEHERADILPCRQKVVGNGRRLNWDSPATNALPITMRLSEPPTPLDLVRSA
jgi:hypothetical protein